MLKTKQTANDPEAVRQNLINRAFNLLSYRPQSLAEMKAKLRRSGADAVAINQVLGNLMEQGALDDLKFAQWWVEQRVRFRPRGNIALTQELSQKGVRREIIAQVLLAPAEELALAKALPEKKRLRRGFSYNVIDALRTNR